MKIHWIQHVPFEGLGCIEDWARDRNHELLPIRLWAGDALPPVGDVAFLTVMGGPMGVDDDDQCGWLESEKELIGACIEQGSTVLGICLGAQLIAATLGADIEPNEHKEIGWYPVRLTDLASDSPLALSPGEFDAFHWHGDRFEIPPGTSHLATSDACANQAFSMGTQILGLQFHLEVRPADIDSLIANCARELVDAKWIQPAQTMRSMSKRCEDANALMRTVLDHLALS